MDKRVILASASPRRRELLEQIGIDFEIGISNQEELYVSTKPSEIVKELASQKAHNVAAKIQGELENVIIIGADTIVVLDNQILGKPKDEEEACQMLFRLQGKPHQVFTGTAILSYDEKGMLTVNTHAEETKVFVHEMDESEINGYIQTGEPMDKAGAYGIQGKFAAYIDKIEGDYYNVVGLPISYIYQQMKHYMGGEDEKTESI